MRNLQAGAGNQSPETAEEAAAEAARRKGSPWDSVPEAVRQSYEQVLKTIIDRPDSITLTDAVEAAYNKCDIQFLALLKEKMASASGDSKVQLVEVADEVNNAMQRRMSSATSKLQTILSAGNPIAIEAAAAKLARAGEADDALVLLLEANLQEAHKAGPQGAGAVRVLTNVKNILQAEIDRKLEPEKRLLKQCLRCDTAEEMEAVLHEAFRPRVKLQLAENKESSDEPLVAPPAFIAAVRNLKLNFGNVGEDETEFADKVDVIISTAEKVATALYGESMSPKDQQDRAWREHGASVWDLEKLENDAMLRGEEMPWANDKYDTMLPNLNKGDKSGEFKIGGS
ncbi:hypothetical protein JKP88DRAFT_176218 [Tribonema minus]|uniref:Uncharacterized protein n=1 Tax=Tribonema minus TaxID=303371 RepID=A0A836CLR4_9STRA|nr:hypothetical protein JKP88DRAFT_176218 [Tribonema minus]